MKSQLPAALVVEGNSTNAPVLKLPRIAEELGPIKSGSLRIARRVSNFLRAGYAVSTYEELQPAKLVLLRVPDSSVERVVAELCASELNFEDLAFVLCDSWLTCEALAPIRLRGSAVGSMCQIHAGQHSTFFAVEGQAGVTRPLRRLLDRCDARTFELKPGTKELLFSAELLTTALPIPLFTAAQQALRACGVIGNPLSSVLEGNAQEMFRAFCAGARLSWGGPLTECSPELAEQHLAVLRKKLPEVAQIVDEQLPAARNTMLRTRQQSVFKQRQMPAIKTVA
jgi:hypothetical protein